MLLFKPHFTKVLILATPGFIQIRWEFRHYQVPSISVLRSFFEIGRVVAYSLLHYKWTRNQLFFSIDRSKDILMLDCFPKNDKKIVYTELNNYEILIDTECVSVLIESFPKIWASSRYQARPLSRRRAGEELCCLRLFND